MKLRKLTTKQMIFLGAVAFLNLPPLEVEAKAFAFTAPTQTLVSITSAFTTAHFFSCLK